MSEYMLQHKVAPIVTIATPVQLPAVVTDPKSRIDAGLAAVKRAQDAFQSVTGPDAYYAKHPVRSFAARHPIVTNTINWASAAGGLAAIGAGCMVDWSFLWLLPGAVVSFLGSDYLAFTGKGITEEANKRTLELKDIEPILLTLQSTSGDDRALMRLFVEQHASELETGKRLTPKAAHALREAIQESAESPSEVQRTGDLVGLANACKKSGEPSNDTLGKLEGLLRDSTHAERLAAADYLESTLFPDERPLSNIDATQARDLFAIIARARRGEVRPPV